MYKKYFHKQKYNMRWLSALPENRGRETGARWRAPFLHAFRHGEIIISTSLHYNGL